MPTYGRQLTGDTGRRVEVAADGFPEWKVGGVTIDWATVTAVTGSPATYEDGTTVPVGAKGIPFGTILCQITASGKFGPYDSAASDGRQTLTRGACYILNETATELAAGGLVPDASDHPAVIEGGSVWRARLRIGGAGQPSVANFEAAFPRIKYVA